MFLKVKSSYYIMNKQVQRGYVIWDTLLLSLSNENNYIINMQTWMETIGLVDLGENKFH